MLKNKDEENNSRGTNLMDFVIYAGRIGGCMKGEFVKEFRIWESRIQINREIFVENKKEIQWSEFIVVLMAKEQPSLKKQ